MTDLAETEFIAKVIKAIQEIQGFGLNGLILIIHLTLMIGLFLGLMIIS